MKKNNLFKYIMENLDSIPTHKRWPQHKGIYFLFENGEICYIGSSNNLYGRIYNHHAFGKTIGQKYDLNQVHKLWDHFTIIQMDVSLKIIRKLEKKLILKYKPKYNKQFLLERSSNIMRRCHFCKCLLSPDDTVCPDCGKN